MRRFTLCFVLLMSAMLSVCACSKKETPKPEEAVTQNANPEDSAKAPEQADAGNTDAALKADAPDDKAPTPKADAEENAPAPKAEAKPIDPEAAKSMDLAVDPKSCVVTHCKSFPGFEENGLDCDTDAIVKSGYKLGDKTLHAMLIKRAGPACEIKDKVVECFLTARDFLKESSLRKNNSLIDLLCDPRDCVLTDVSQCDESDKDLAVDPKTCLVTHCKSFPGFEEDGLECNTDAIVKAEYQLGDVVNRLTYRTFTGENCHNPNGLPDLTVKCFLNSKDFIKECKAQHYDYCDNDTFFIENSTCPKLDEK